MLSEYYMLKKEIKYLVEQIMDPSTTDEERCELNNAYTHKLKLFKQHGYIFDEVYSKSGWKPIRGLSVNPDQFSKFANSLK